MLLEQAGDLVARGDHETTKKLVDQYRMFKVDVATSTLNPDVIYQRAVNLAMKPKTSPQLAAARKAVSMAQLAIDKGELDKARVLVDEALALNIPDTEFGPDDVRPWQLDLQLGKKAAAKKVAPVVTASATTSGSEQMVRQADYNPSVDTTRNVQVSAAEPMELMAMKRSSCCSVNCSATFRAKQRFRNE